MNDELFLQGCQHYYRVCTSSVNFWLVDAPAVHDANNLKFQLLHDCFFLAHKIIL